MTSTPPRSAPDTQAARVGPRPEPPPERLDTWVVLDLLATTRRWRVNDPFVAGQTDGLARALVACLNAKQRVPRWLRRELVSFLIEALWEEGKPDPAARDALVSRWRDPR